MATRFILLSSTAESSSKSGYVAVPEHFLQNDEASVNNVERARKKPIFVSNSINKHVIMIFYDYFSVFLIILVHFQYFPLMENLFDHLFMLLFIVSARE